ncbi:MAG: lipopolysaccharide biosynthesis protein [Muribaculaceae bacterium]|nr:lipopolysaccharide biosynthesis protein [Muribaculaceae bacterium]
MTSKSLKSVIFWNAISQFGTSGVSFLSTIILARLLSPSDFGLLGLISIFIAISQMMIDAQMGGALLRKKDVDKIDYSTLFWFNLAISIVLYLVLFFVAPVVADFYSEPILKGLIRVLALTFFIFACRVTQRVMIFRECKFHIMALINISSGLLALISAIWFANRGYGVWSLVLMQLVNGFAALIMMFIYNRFIPLLKFSRESFQYQFHFGINILGAEFLKSIVNNIGTNIIGKISSLQFTGYYTQSSKITDFVNGCYTGILDQSIFPYMSRLSDFDKITGLYKKLFLLIIIGTSCAVVVLYCFAYQIVELILGVEWVSATPVFRVLCIGIIPMTAQTICRNLLKTLGITSQIFKIEIWKTLCLGIGFACCFSFGATAIIWSIVLVQYISAIIWIGISIQMIKKRVYKP